MSPEPIFPRELLLKEPARGARLVQDFYEQYHEGSRSGYCPGGRQHEERKSDFYRRQLEAQGHDETSIGLDVGCGIGVMIKMVGLIRWIGIDLNHSALQVARESGIPCAKIDFTSAIGFRDESLDAVMMTEVLEHLPYPSIIVREVHRILRRNPRSGYVGSVPLDYHLHRRWKVLRGKRLSGEQTHVHHFSFNELDRLLRFHFETVHYLPLSGTAFRYP
ncbi:MAG: class I SAM-dependent methyltransferase, partial [Verrucomicrobiota bacterium]